jgi:Mce-associated membrane protein
MTVTTEKKQDPDTDEKLDAAEAEADTDDTATEDTTDDTDAGDTADEVAEVGRRWPRRVLISSAIAIFIAALAGSGFLGWQLWQERQVDQAGQAAQRAAVAYAQVLTSIDSNKVDENFTQVLDGATGEFKDMYSQSSMQLRQLLIDNKATAHGVVVDSAVQSASKDRVVVLLFVDQSVSNTSVPDPRVDRSRIKMTMENVDGHWRASKVELP